MRIIDLHCYPGTQTWIDAQGPYPDALATYWKRDWVAKGEDAVIAEFADAGVQACLVALDLETTVATPPCDNDYVHAIWKRHPDRVIQCWGAVEPASTRLAFSDTRNAASTDRARNWLAAGSYDFGLVRVHAAYGGNKGFGAAESADMLVGASVPLGLSRVVTSFVKKNDKSVANNDAQQIALGYMYNLSKRTHLHASVGRIKNTLPNTSPAFYTLGTPAGPATGSRLVTVGVGHFF